MPVSVLIVEDSEAIRHGVCSILQDSAEFNVVGEASDGVQGISQSEILQPDVILLDLSMPILSGLGAAPRMLQVSPDSKILMFSHYDSASIVTASLKAGALGYVMKSDAGKDLMAGLLATSQGKQFVSTGGRYALDHYCCSSAYVGSGFQHAYRWRLDPSSSGRGPGSSSH